jgi:hypothetical protein
MSKEQTMAQVKIAGVTGVVDMEIEDGHTVVDVLVAAAKQLGVEESVVKHLSPVVDGAEVSMTDAVPAGAKQLTAAPGVSNG